MNNRILELANQCFINENKLTSNQIESFYNRAHQDGQKQMRERAAKECEQESKEWEMLKSLAVARDEHTYHESASILSANRCVKAIRNLEITNE